MFVLSRFRDEKKCIYIIDRLTEYMNVFLCLRQDEYNKLSYNDDLKKT